MSILRRMTSHLDDAAFAELWTNAIADRTTPAEHPHLRGCAECRLRFTSFSYWMEDLRVDGLGAANDALPLDGLAAQQALIFRRLEAADRPARVIAFPTFPSGVMRPSPVRRWVAAAAAAGLIAGVGLGQMLNLRQISLAPSAFPRDGIATIPRPLPQAPTTIPVVAMLNEDVTLAELEEAAVPHYEALRAYDTFTPRAADFIRPR